MAKTHGNFLIVSTSYSCRANDVASDVEKGEARLLNSSCETLYHLYKPFQFIL